jgi:hypothetical protein
VGGCLRQSCVLGPSSDCSRIRVCSRKRKPLQCFRHLQTILLNDKFSAATSYEKQCPAAVSRRLTRIGSEMLSISIDRVGTIRHRGVCVFHFDESPVVRSTVRAHRPLLSKSVLGDIGYVARAHRPLHLQRMRCRFFN